MQAWKCNIVCQSPWQDLLPKTTLCALPMIMAISPQKEKNKKKKTTPKKKIKHFFLDNIWLRYVVIATHS